MEHWSGLRKHVVAVAYSSERTFDMDQQKVDYSPFGYFVVTFDETDHKGGTYFYPAENENQVREWRDGTLDPTEFYGW